MRLRLSLVMILGLWGALLGAARADRLELQDGTVLEGVYVRDDALQYLVWETLDRVGHPPDRILPRSRVRKVEVHRGDDWDRHPPLPDLTVPFIELSPKLAGLHGRVLYDAFGRPRIGGAPALVALPEERAYQEPERIVQGLKLRYEPGEPITLTAHVKNVGFAPAGPFRYVWEIDDQPTESGRFEGSLGEMEETSFSLRWNWEAGQHWVTFRVDTDQAEIATLNNVARDPLWGWGLVYVTHPKRLELWHQNRTAYGTFSFEDFYRWHLDIMNALMEASRYPSTPNGVRARVRLDRIVVTEDVEAEAAGGFAEDGIRYDQGRWLWIDDGDRKGLWQPPTKEWRNQTEWSLLHELGHQLGLVDLYRLDYAGDENHRWPDNGKPISHFYTRPWTMMHWHGPHLWSEIHAAYLDRTWNQPRGHYGDFYFAVPEHNELWILDINGRGVPEAQVALFQRGVQLDPNGTPQTIDGATVYPVIEDGNFSHPVSAEPVIVGHTDAEGRFRLPNRPVAPVRTLNGYARRPNPFGNMDVVGDRGLMLVRVQKGEWQSFFWLELADFVVAWHRGQKERFVLSLQTIFPSIDSPPAPERLQVEPLDAEGTRVRVRWEPPAVRELHPYDRVIGYRVFRRISNLGENERPWFPVATVGPEQHEVVIDLRQQPEDMYFYDQDNRIGVAAIGELNILSGLKTTVVSSVNP